MADPTKKNPELEAQLEELAKKMGSPIGRIAAIKNDVCVSCQRPASSFRDVLSQREFTISGLCQKCQDEVFG